MISGVIVQAARVGELLKSHGMMLVTAESCTGGLIAGAVTEVAGSSQWFERGFVTYSNQSKMEMLGVSAETLQLHGAVSKATVCEMAAGALRFSKADMALAVSGIAGPQGGTPQKPVGTIWFAWGRKNELVLSKKYFLAGSRNEIRIRAIEIALEGVVQILKENATGA